MLFKLIIIIFINVVFVALCGNYEAKRMKEQSKEWEKIMREKYK